MAETEVEEKNRGGAMAGFGRLVAGASKASLLKRLEKMRAAVKEQSARVLCVCDFDHTISAYHLYDEASRLAGKGDDTKSLSSHSIVENAGLLGEAFREESKRRFEKYYPLETNPRLGIGERQKICEQWWGESHDAIISAGFTRGMVAQAVEATSSSIRMREGAADFFALFQSKEEEEARRRELIVFSAGLGNVIQQILLNHKFTGSLIDCCGNTMFFEMDKGDDAKVVSFGEIIHSCNKGEAVARECRHLHGGEGEGEVKTAAAAGEAAAAAGATTVAFGRNHDSSAQKQQQQQQQQEAPFVCVVVGDSVGDCAMGDSLQPVGGEEGCLRVGYLNHDDASHGRREHYIKAGFDLLIVGDGPLNAVSAIIRGLGGEEELLEVLVGAAEEL